MRVSSSWVDETGWHKLWERQVTTDIPDSLFGVIAVDSPERVDCEPFDSQGRATCKSVGGGVRVEYVWSREGDDPYLLSIEVEQH